MPRKNRIKERIDQLIKKDRETVAKNDRLNRENKELLARAKEAERQLAELLELDERNAFGEVQEEAR